MQLLADGVMVNTTESIVKPLFVIVCAGIFPLPLPVYPVRLPLWVTFQLNVVFAVADVILTMLLLVPLHIVCAVSGSIIGDGLTKMVSFTATPGQPVELGVTA